MNGEKLTVEGKETSGNGGVNPIDAALTSGAATLDSRATQRMLGYHTRQDFWRAVKREKIPTIKISAKNVRFPALGLREWLTARGQNGATI